MYAKLTKFEEELVKKGRGNDALHSMMSRFNKGVQDYGLLRELKQRRFYVKPSVLRSKKKLNKKIKTRRENALHQKRIQEYIEQGYRLPNRDSEPRKERRR